MESSTELTEVSVNKCFEGYQKVFSHKSKVLKCTMKFAIYLPPVLNTDAAKAPVIYWLSGLTCTEQNFITKAGAQKHAAKYGIVVVAPDTSPRGVNIAGEDDSYDFGSGAGFYVDATEEPWKTNYNMYSYITEELPEIINSNFPVNANAQSIMGHSMGGHGALVCYLRNPGKYKSVSAFSAVCNPTKCPWGKKAFTGYLGPDETKWEQYDATILVKKCTFPTPYIFIDQGSDDDFYKNGQLLPHNFLEACKESNVPVVLNMREGYDHSYFYISSFIEDHFSFHSKYLSDLI